MINRILTVAVALLLLCAPKSIAAPTDDQVASAQTASKAWLALIDAGQYQASYQAGSSAMQEKTTQDTWILVLKALRPSWGAVVERKPVSNVLKPDGYEGAQGQYMIITYETSFKKLTAGTEVVVLKWEGGRWRGAGYNAVAKTTDQASN